jgi:hypothetical protein
MEIVNINYTGAGKKVSNYSQKDSYLINLDYVNSAFGDANDYIETFVYDQNGLLLDSNYKFTDYKLGDVASIGTNKYSSIILDPSKDVKYLGFDRGKVNIQYNFLKNLFNSKQGVFYWIKEISPSRRELKLSSQDISGDSMNQGLQSFQSYILSKNYYSDFYLNFGTNNLVLAVNAAYIEDDNDNPHILIKLYEPLPFDYDIKSTLWIVDKVAESVSYDVDIQIETEVVDIQNTLRGPNYNVQIIEKIGQTTPYYTYNSLFSADTSSSIQQLISYYDDKGISINVDFANFDNFVHFSSATERLKNFQYKVGLIESYNNQINDQRQITGNSQVVSASVQVLQNNIDKIIEKFDIYDYYLYYESESFAWPKSTSTKPYSLYSITSSQAVNWLGNEDLIPSGITTASLLYSASAYDGNNINNLVNVVPNYLIDDPNNAPYITFINMIGQHFDNIWVYYKDLSNRYNATNNPKTGISLDLVGEAIKGFGIELYTNTNLSDDVYYTLFGVGQSGTLLPPTGSEVIETYVTSSYNTLPYNQVQKEIYKRIYHNLPYLLKTRGTERGVKALIACYGIPDNILSVNQFGGYDRLDKIGLVDLNNDKIRIISQSNELSESVLSPYSTLQHYDNDNRLNSNVIEIGFSPADELNRQISSSLGFFSIDNLIGNPSDQYSSTYSALDSQRNTYFSSYTGKHNIWEYIRLIKYYNNSLFKIVKDFVPARSTVSSGIIIKPHILERSKYARHEPSASMMELTQSIDMVEISGDHANSYTISSTVQKNIPSKIGYAQYTSSVGYEKYTGEFQGTDFSGRDSYTFNQKDSSNNASILNSITITGVTQSYYFGDTVYFSQNPEHRNSPISIQRSATFNNVSTPVRSKRFLDVDYSTDMRVPVNMDIITKTISRSLVDNYDTYTDINTPYAYIQDYNYYIQRSTIPRYYGSKLEGLKINYYSTASDSWQGDTSYGSYPVLERRSGKIALFTQIQTSSFFPGLVNATLGYLVDAAAGLHELNLENNNWFEVQNIFKSGKNLTIKQFDNKKYSNQKTTDGQKFIFESGYTYNAMLYFNEEVDTKVYFTYLGEADAYLEAHNDYDPNNMVTGSTTLDYPIISTNIARSASVYNIFDNVTSDAGNNFTIGSSDAKTFPTYSIAYAGNYQINANFLLNITASAITDSGSFTLNIIKNGEVVASQNKLFGGNSIIDNNWYVSFGGIIGGA